MSDQETSTKVTITLDGRQVEAEPGELVIAAAERHGNHIPRFCWHPRMREVGMCRMCIVEIDTGRGPALQPSCMVPVSDGMVVTTDSDVTKKAQDGVLEFLLANHPLDCPVCDKGGECPLQDNAYAFGPGESRFVEEKRHYEKPIPISDLVLLDRERCILCDRCTRFSKEVAGDTLIHFQDRGNQTEVNTFPGHPFASYFSGNTVQICPVGALTAEPYRFKARPWDLDQVESTCTSCSVGCRVAVQASRNEVIRYQGVDVDGVNWGWLCDKGRFDFESIHADARLGTPLVRDGDTQRETSWSDALGRTASAIADALDAKGPGGIGIIGGARLTNESAYAWAKLAKGIIGTDNVDAQLGDGLPADAVLGLPKATIDEVCAPGGTILLVGADPKEELPVLFLRLRHAVVEDGATLVQLVPAGSSLSDLAAATVTYSPGTAAQVAAELGKPDPLPVGAASSDAIGAARALLAGGPITVVAGRGNLADSADSMAAALGAIHDAFDATFLSGLRRGNVHGALDAGLAPGILPGRVRLDEGRTAILDRWSTVPPAPGLDTTGMLEAAADGRMDVLVLLGADPLADFPDAELARRALAAARTVIAVDTLPSASTVQADVVLPAAGYAETTGTTTNLEGRISRVSQKVTPPGTARADWMIAGELAFRLNDDLGIADVAELFAEWTAVSPSHAGIALDDVGLDGIVVGTQAVPTEDSAADHDPEADPDAAEAAVAADAADDVAEQQAAEAEAAEAQAEAETEAGDDAPDADTAEASPGPARIRFEPPTVAPVPPADGYKLRLITTRKLYDLGAAAQASASLAGLAPEASVALNPADFDKLGVEVGTVVHVSNREGGRGSVSVPVESSTAVPRGAAQLRFHLPGGAASSLIDASTPVTEVRVEVAR